MSTVMLCGRVARPRLAPCGRAAVGPYRFQSWGMQGPCRWQCRCDYVKVDRLSSSEQADNQQSRDSEQPGHDPEQWQDSQSGTYRFFLGVGLCSVVPGMM